MTAYREGTAYLVVQRGRLAGQLKATRVTQRMPATVEPGGVVVKVRLRVEADAWHPLEPETTVDVPATHVAAPVVTPEDLEDSEGMNTP